MINNNEFIRCGECERNNWLVKNMPYVYEQDEISVHMENVTNEAKTVARELFKNGKEISPIDGVYDTQRELRHDCTLFNACFENEYGFAKIDILEYKNGKCNIYLVKSGSNIFYFAKELSFQKSVVCSNGIPVENMYLILINKDYVRKRKLDPKKLFTKVNVNHLDTSKTIFRRLRELERIQSLPCEPYFEMKKRCQRCGFFNHCFRDLPENNIFTISGMNFSDKLELYKKGIISFRDFKAVADEKKHRAYLKQVNCTLSNKPIVNRQKLREFMKKLKYPLGFLDFETVAPLIPEFENTAPGALIVTQFSYHLIEKEGDKPKHFEFCGNGIKFPEHELCRELVKAIKPNHTVLMYSPYEKMCINHLMADNKKYEKELETIRNNLVDLETPFRLKYLYHPDMQGRSSIKKVLPALYPHSRKFSYEALDVKNGAMAIDKYSELKSLPKEEREQAIKELLTYCGMDTLAMVALVDKIKEYAGL